MGKIDSAATIYATAYLTDKGREYLFNKNNIRFDNTGADLLEIKTFTLSDPDVNYTTSMLLESGDVPDVTGKSEGCIKATANYLQSSVLYYQVDLIALADPIYDTDAPTQGPVDLLVLNISDPNVFPVAQNTDVPPSA